MTRPALIAALALAAAPMAAGCTPQSRPATEVPGVECSAEHLDSVIGKPRSEPLGAEALRLSGAKHLRWITPGMMVTMDFRTDRLNLNVGANGKVLSAKCG